MVLNRESHVMHRSCAKSLKREKNTMTQGQFNQF